MDWASSAGCLSRCETTCRRGCRGVTNASAYFFIGRGIQFTGLREGALKMKEITSNHTEDFTAGCLSQVDDDNRGVRLRGQPAVAVRVASYHFYTACESLGYSDENGLPTHPCDLRSQRLKHTSGSRLVPRHWSLTDVDNFCPRGDAAEIGSSISLISITGFDRSVLNSIHPYGNNKKIALSASTRPPYELLC